MSGEFHQLPEASLMSDTSVQDMRPSGVDVIPEEDMSVQNRRPSGESRLPEVDMSVQSRRPSGESRLPEDDMSVSGNSLSGTVTSTQASNYEFLMKMSKNKDIDSITDAWKKVDSSIESEIKKMLTDFYDQKKTNKADLNVHQNFANHMIKIGENTNKKLVKIDHFVLNNKTSDHTLEDIKYNLFPFGYYIYGDSDIFTFGRTNTISTTQSSKFELIKVFGFKDATNGINVTPKKFIEKHVVPTRT